jgi:hypothetical protein
MEDRQRDSISTTPNHPNIRQPKITSNQADHHIFHVHCLSTKKTLNDKKYTSLEDIKKDAFILYKEINFNDNNAILTYMNDNNVEVLLDSVPDLPVKGDSKDLFIRFVCIFFND